MKNNRIKIGEDSRVDEAIMITFFTSMISDVTNAYNKYMLYKNEQEKTTLKDKEKDLKRFHQAVSDYGDLETHSEGEGRDRHVILSKKEED